MSIRSCLVSQPNIKIKLNTEQSINSMDLSPITFGVNLPPKLRGKISTISQINLVNLEENKYSIVRTIKIFLDSGACVSIVRKDILLKIKRINGQLCQGPLILVL